MDSLSDPIPEFTTILESMGSLKAPGVTKSKIDAVLKWSLEQQAVQAVVQYTKKARPTHKLGMIYVVDSITRQWSSRIPKPSSDSSKSEGTFESGVKHMTYYLPELMTLLISEAPVDQKEKISNLVAIWEHSITFPKEMVNEFKNQLQNFDKIRSTEPSAQLESQDFAGVPTGPASTVDIQAALASLLPRAQSAIDPSPSLDAGLADTAKLLASLTQVTSAVAPAPAAYPTTQSQLSSMLSAVAASAHAPAPAPVHAPYPSYSQAPPPQAPAAAAASESSVPAQHLEVFSELWQLLNGTGLSSEKTIEIFTFFHKAMTVASQSASSTPAPPTEPSHAYANQQQPAYARRDRSRSRSPSYFDRQPARRESPPDMSQGHHPISWDDTLHDYRNGSSRRGYIKVLSRTLFVGGVSATEGQLHDMFSKCGTVQSVIVNSEKRHAFVKMFTRAHAEIARKNLGTCPNRPGIEDPTGHGELNLPYFRQTRWGVGFGPRECMNYDTGISVIDIDVLTPADGDWLVSALFGGTGGRKVEPGMIVEEPDIEIGGGVSSKAISKRIHPQPELSSSRPYPPAAPARHGPPPAERGWGGPPSQHYKEAPPSHYKEYNDGGGGGHNAYSRRPSPPRSPRQETHVGVPPAVPGFGFSMPGSGMR